ncbi:MAG: type IV pilus modification protein PilV, partial [Gammaproteobacteria bacterium]|nr:type IV pilus modification protein PilV [Gammaproteobacteria bacterium]
MNRRYQSGVSLIEILVTVLVLGIGLLGVAALQVTSINSNQEGLFRGQATEIAESVAARMRSAKLAIYDGTTTLNQVITAYAEEPYACANPPTSCITGTCSAAQLVAFDKYETCLMAQNELPEGQIYVRLMSGVRSRVVVAWTPAAARSDLGQKQILNAECA